jgi:hypothetical protein
MGLQKNTLQLHKEVDMSQLCIDWLAMLTHYAGDVPMYSTKTRSGDLHFCNCEVSNKILTTVEDELPGKGC